MPNTACSRRDFLAATGAAALIGPWSTLSAAQSKSPNEKLNIGVVGVGNRGRSNLQGVRGENVVALCDIDERTLFRAKEDFPQAKTFVDWRRMLDDKTLDAVLVSTPDHTHAVIGTAAMKSGQHLYCEKPLAHTIYEARVMAETAARTGVVTQLGNQNHATDRLRSVVEFVRAGGLGTVSEVVCWSGKTAAMFAPGDRPTETAPVPKHVHWDLWLGPAPETAYHPTAYHPRNWRGWWDFGEGNFGDMACHIVDAPFWALDLDYPETVAAEGPPVHPDSAPPWLIVRFQFPARSNRPPVKLTWYDGIKAPPQDVLPNVELPSQGCLFIGEKGKLLFPHTRGETQLFVGSDSVPIAFPEPSLSRPENHHQEWIAACKGQGKTYSNFAYGGRLTETALAGVIAYRTGAELKWDAKQMKAANCPEAEQYVRTEFRKGWTL
jgi:predicted dehydrogenase